MIYRISKWEYFRKTFLRRYTDGQRQNIALGLPWDFMLPYAHILKMTTKRTWAGGPLQSSYESASALIAK